MSKKARMPKLTAWPLLNCIAMDITISSTHLNKCPDLCHWLPRSLYTIRHKHHQQSSATPIKPFLPPPGSVCQLGGQPSSGASCQSPTCCPPHLPGELRSSLAVGVAQSRCRPGAYSSARLPQGQALTDDPPVDSARTVAAGTGSAACDDL